MSVMPLYYSIYKDLHYKICSGEYEEGTQLPKETELEKIYGVSRAPVRQALGYLEVEKLISRVRGKGTFVSKNKQRLPWLLSTGMSKCYEREWNNLTHKTILVEQVEPPKVVSDFLNLGNQKAIHLVRLQSVLDSPVVLMHNYTFLEFDEDSLKDAGDFMSWKELMLSKYNKSISIVVENLSVKQISAFDARYLNIEPGSFCLCNVRKCYDEEESPLNLIICYIQQNNWEYEVVFHQPETYRVEINHLARDIT